MPILADVSIKDNASWTTMLNMIYPVGSYYISVDSTSPANRFGGSWTAIQNARYPLFLGDNRTGGNYNIAIAHLPAHTHPAIRYDPDNFSTTVNRNVAALHHTGSSYAYGWYNSNLSVGETDSSGLVWSDGGTGSWVGGGQSFYPAYQGVYAWYRTA